MSSKIGCEIFTQIDMTHDAGKKGCFFKSDFMVTNNYHLTHLGVACGLKYVTGMGGRIRFKRKMKTRRGITHLYPFLRYH